MREYWLQYRPFLVFLGKFLVTYVVLTSLYQFYLSASVSGAFQVDPFTRSVAHQVEWLLANFDDGVSVLPHSGEASLKIYYRHHFVARVVEGCNAISVIILFIAFVVAFKGKPKTTLWFILGGSIFVHVLNIIRIAILAAALYHFPEYEDLLHGVLFPLVIYGTVFLLWVVWVNKFSFYARPVLEK